MSAEKPTIEEGILSMIVDGRALALEVLARARTRAEVLSRPPRALAIVANETPATRAYLAVKQKRAADADCTFDVTHIKDSLRPYDIVDRSRNADAVIVQLPLPAGIDAGEVCDAIPLEKDADVLSSAARKKFERGDTNALLPPVVGAIAEIFKKHAIGPRGKKAVVIGAGFLVGTPTTIWLEQQGARVAVLTAETKPEEFTAALRAADIIVSGAGSPYFIKPEMLKQGVVLIDAGVSELGGAVVGDADPACAAKCSLFTPVPGGIGPLAVACLFENVVTLAEQANSSILSP